METMTNEERERKYKEYTERAFWTGHYHFLVQALAIAMQSTTVWRLVGSGDPFTLKDLFEFAKKRDEEDPLDEMQFYMVSAEGAIGLSPGLEFLNEWIFIPMEPCEEREQLLKKMEEELKEQTAIRDAVDEAVEEGLARERNTSTAWYLWQEEQQQGPFTVDELAGGRLTADMLVWTEGMESWIPAGQVPELASALTPPQQPVAPPQPPRPVTAASYYMLDSNNQNVGPFTADELLRHGLTSNTYVWTEGMSEWTYASNVPELSSMLASLGR